MALKHIDEYRDSDIAKSLIQKIKDTSNKPVRLMEVCGTHTVSIFRSGIRTILPPTISLLSGPGCPVCVTDQSEIDAFIELSRLEDVIITTFGDLMRVPGTTSSLQKQRAEGKDIRVVYSTFDALEIAKKNPDKKVVFLGVGFETTAPTIAAAIYSAEQMKIENFSVISAHKLVPPALEALMATENVMIDGFILPGHVSVIIGEKAYLPFCSDHQIPSVIAGFEPTDILQAIGMLVEQIAQSGLRIRRQYEGHDAGKIFDIKVTGSMDPKGCACGEILTGTKTPPECPLYKTVCTPIDPVGPCMVSTEGTCAAYYKYHV